MRPFLTRPDCRAYHKIMKLSGTVASSLANVGSKSERVAYNILPPDGRNIRLYKSGDNPFTNTSLVPFDGQEVEVTGDFDGDLFVVAEIHKIAEAARRR
jgi:hypothetical protein